MRRREFLSGLGGTAAWPAVARSQQPKMPVIGYLHSGFPDSLRSLTAAFHQGLNETGHVEARNIAIEYRWAEGHSDRLPGLAAELVDRHVGALFASGGATAVLAAKAATSVIPIVFSTGSDPIKVGLVASLNRPGGNVTGASFFGGALEPKRLELLHELMPQAAEIGVLVNPNTATGEFRIPEMQAAARALGVQLRVLTASTDEDFEGIFVNLAQQKIEALLISTDPLFVAGSGKLIMLAARYAIPTVYGSREIAAAGGLVSYGTSISDAYRLAGVYIGRILKGEKPADLPVQQSTKIELIVNLKTAKALRLTVPPTLLARADEVIE